METRKTLSSLLKIRVYGKCERQKLPRDHDFPAIFHVCRLPFAVFSAKRTVFAFVNNVSIYRKFFNLSTTFTGLCLCLMLFYFIFYAKQSVNSQLIHKKEENVRESELMLKCLH